jgi:hypothetical protein
MEQYFPCPTTIPVYNDAMKGCDVSDQNTAYYDSRRKVKGRWQPRLERRVFKTALVNANILKNGGKPKSEQQSLLNILKAVVVQWGGIDVGDQDAVDDDSDDSWSEVADDEDEMPKRRNLKTWSCDVKRRKTGCHLPQIRSSTAQRIGKDKVYTNPRSKCILCKRNVASLCQTCGVHLCLKRDNGRDCFGEFHTKNTLK